jgi:predicted permease
MDMMIMGGIPIVMILSFLFFGLLLFVLNIVTSIWAYRDSIRKGNSKEYAIIVLIGTLVFPVLGLIVYLIIRNDKV